MHEFSLVGSILEAVTESAAENGIGSVTRVKISVGEFHGALPEVLSFAFRALSADTVCAGAELDIEITKGILLCAACGRQFPKSVPHRKCPECGSFSLEIISGRELQIDYFEGE